MSGCGGQDATVGVWWPGAVTRVRLLIKPSVTGKSSVPYKTPWKNHREGMILPVFVCLYL